MSSTTIQEANSMLKEQMEKYLKSSQEGNEVIVFAEEKEYLEKHQMNVPELSLKNEEERFLNAYIERCDKESENLIKQESFSFLKESLDFLKKHKNDFIYVESSWFELIGVDAVSLEVDDVFGTYDVMLGLKLQKKFAQPLKDYLNEHLHNNGAKFDLVFNGDEGLWSLNFALNYVKGFREQMTIGEAYAIIYQFLFRLVEAVEA